MKWRQEVESLAGQEDNGESKKALLGEGTLLIEDLVLPPRDIGVVK